MSSSFSKRLKSSMVLAAIALLTISSVACQEGECLMVNPTDAKLLYGDVYSIDLDSITTGNNAAFSIGTSLNDTMEPPYTFKEAFNPNGEIDALKLGTKSCSYYTGGLNENDFIFLCDQSRLAFVTYYQNNGSVKASSVLELPAGLVCHSVTNSAKKEKGYAACLNGTSSISLVKFDLLNPSVQGILNIEQTVVAQTLKKDLRLIVDDFNFDKGVDTVIYIYENADGTEKVRFKMAKDSSYGLIYGGYYSTSNDSTEGLNDGSLVGFYFDGNNVLIATRKGTRNQIQKCYRSPVYSKYHCEPTELNLFEGTGFIRMYNTDPTLRTNKLFDMYLVNSNEIIVGTYSPEEFSYSETGRFNIKGNSLKKIIDVINSGNDLFLFGPTTDNQNLVDGVVRFKIASMGYDQYSYPEAEATLAFARRDFYDTSKTDLFFIGADQSSFYKVDRNRLIINTWEYEKGYEQINFTVNCTADEKLVSSASFMVATLVDINSGEVKFNVPKVNAYYGQVKVKIPSSSENIRGNAPKISLKDKTAKYGLEVDLSSVAPIDSNIPQGLKVTDANYIGGQASYFTTPDAVKFFTSSVSSKKVKVTSHPLEISLKDRIFLAADEEDGYILTVTASKPAAILKPLLAQVPEDKLYIRLVYLKDGKDVFPEVVITFTSKLAVARIENGRISVVAVGSEKKDYPQGIYYIQFDDLGTAVPSSMKLIQYLEAHICPTEISWAPRQTPTFYIASICSQDSQDNHIYQFFVNFDRPSESYIGSTFRVVGSKQFNICAQNRLVNVIDYESNKAYSFDTFTGTDSIFVLPLGYYGINSVKNHVCNQDDNIVHIIGSDGISQTNKMIIFRAEETDFPETRIHSVVDIGPFSKVAASYSDLTDEVMTVFFGETTSSSGSALVYVDGPHLRIDISTLEQDILDFNITYQITLPGKDKDNSFERVSALSLQLQQTEIQATFEGQKLLPADGALVNLDQQVAFSGPYRSLDKQASANLTIINDRLTKSNLFNNVTTIYSRSVFYKDYIFGVVVNQDGSKSLVLSQNTTELIRVDNTDAKVFDYVVKKGSVKFFALVARPLKNDQITTFYNNGDSWIVASTDLQSKGYEDAYFTDGPDSNYLLSCINNRDDYIFQVVAFQVLDQDIALGLPFSIQLEDNIADFEVVAFDQGNVVVIIGPQFSIQANFYWLKIVDGTLIDIMGTTQIGLIPNFIESHEEIVFDCMRSDDSKAFICVNSGKNLFSYVVKFNVDFSVESPNEFIPSSQVTSLLRNVVNLTPVKVDLNGDYVSFVARNEAFKIAEISLSKIVSFFNDPFIVLVYKLSVPTKTRFREHKVLDPYKILVAEDLGITEKTPLPLLNPRIFIDTSGQNYKLGLNVGFKNSTLTDSIRVFNLDPLAIAAQKSKTNGDMILSFTGIDGKTNTLKLSSIFDFTSDEPPKKAKSPWIWIIIILSVIIIGAVVAAALVMKKKEQPADEAINEGPESTMKASETVSESGNYSKI